MSLINEALKQAKTDMSSRQASPPPLQRPEPPLPPGVPPPKLRHRKRRTGEILLGAFVFILLLLVLGGVAGGLYFIMSQRRPATVKAPAEKSVPGTTAAAENGETPAAGADSTGAASSRPGKGGKTVAGKTPATQLGKAAAQARSAAHKVAHLEAQAAIMNPPPANAGKPAPPKPANAQTTGAATKPAPPPQAVDSGPEPAPPEIARKYRLTGIVQRGAERLALINGAIIRKGQRIRGGRLVRIEDTWVAIEAEGKTYRLDLPMDSIY